MAEATIQEKFKLYLEMQKELTAFRKKQAEQKKLLLNLESEIKEYMEKNKMDSISLKEGEIVLYDRKVSQTFKRDTIVECLKDKLKGDEKKAEELTESILSNKVFNVEQKIKCTIKKK
jgi:hypothetical protein